MTKNWNHSTWAGGAALPLAAVVLADALLFSRAACSSICLRTRRIVDSPAMNVRHKASLGQLPPSPSVNKTISIMPSHATVPGKVLGHLERRNGNTWTYRRLARSSSWANCPLGSRQRDLLFFRKTLLHKEKLWAEKKGVELLESSHDADSATSTTSPACTYMTSCLLQ